MWLYVDNHGRLSVLHWFVQACRTWLIKTTCTGCCSNMLILGVVWLYKWGLIKVCTLEQIEEQLTRKEGQRMLVSKKGPYEGNKAVNIRCAVGALGRRSSQWCGPSYKVRDCSVQDRGSEYQSKVGTCFPPKIMQNLAVEGAKKRSFTFWVGLRFKVFT